MVYGNSPDNDMLFYFDPETGQQSLIHDLGDMLGIGTTARQNQFNAGQAKLQREWEEYMSNTQYQRLVKDMTKAGLNPGLAYTTGGESYHSGGQASAGQINPSAPNLINSAANMINAIGNTKTNKNDAVKTAMTIVQLLSMLG